MPSFLVNGESQELPAEPFSVAELLETLGLQATPCAVEVNRELVPRHDHSARTLADGDEVEVVTLVGGG